MRLLLIPVNNDTFIHYFLLDEQDQAKTINAK